MNKDLKKLKRKAERNGWTVTFTNGGHLKWIPSSGPFIISSSTPSDRRSITNLKARLRNKLK